MRALCGSDCVRRHSNRRVRGSTQGRRKHGLTSGVVESVVVVAVAVAAKRLDVVAAAVAASVCVGQSAGMMADVVEGVEVVVACPLGDRLLPEE